MIKNFNTVEDYKNSDKAKLLQQSARTVRVLLAYWQGCH